MIRVSAILITTSNAVWLGLTANGMLEWQHPGAIPYATGAMLFGLWGYAVSYLWKGELFRG